MQAAAAVLSFERRNFFRLLNGYIEPAKREVACKQQAGSNINSLRIQMR